MIDPEFFLDHDNSPLIVFDRSGGIAYLNHAAEILMGHVDARHLHRLALTHAPHDFGSLTTAMELHFGSWHFYAITVAYRDEEHIGLYLYYRPLPQALKPVDPARLKTTNIHTILEASLALFSLQNPARFDLLTDADLPPFMLDQNAFSRLLRKCLHLFRTSTDLHIRLSMAIGESMRVDATRYPIVRLQMQAQTRHNDAEASLRQLAADQQILLDLDTNAIRLDIPFIQSDQMPKI
jgi:nitrogen-specific signal transduction histidine kinase